MNNGIKCEKLEDYLKVINNPERLASLKQLNIIYTPSEERFDRITRMACSVFEMPIALISFVMLDNMLWYKSKQGTTESGVLPSEMMSMCGRCIMGGRCVMGDDPLVIEDTYLNETFKDNILVKYPLLCRFTLKSR